MPSYLHCTCGTRTTFVYQSGVDPSCSVCGLKGTEDVLPVSVDNAKVILSTLMGDGVDYPPEQPERKTVDIKIERMTAFQMTYHDALIVINVEQPDYFMNGVTPTVVAERMINNIKQKR